MMAEPLTPEDIETLIQRLVESKRIERAARRALTLANAGHAVDAHATLAAAFEEEATCHPEITGPAAELTC